MEITLDSLKRSDVRVGAYIEFAVSCQKEFSEKNKEYGQTWLCYRPKSLLTRMWNKGLRIRSIQDKKEQSIGDTILDEFKAIYNFSVIAIIITKRLNNDKLAALSRLRIDMTDNVEHLYKEAREKCHELFVKKDHDYDGAWVEMAASSIIDEIMVKLMRANNLISKSYDIPVEQFREKLLEILMDIANYAAFAGILLERCNVNPLS